MHFYTQTEIEFEYFQLTDLIRSTLKQFVLANKFETRAIERTRRLQGLFQRQIETPCLEAGLAKSFIG